MHTKIRTLKFPSVLRNSHNITTALDLELLLDLILDQISTSIDYTESIILTADHDEFRVLNYHGAHSQENIFQWRISTDIDNAQLQFFDLYIPFFISDTEDNTQRTQAFFQLLGQEMKQIFDDVRSWLWMPLLLKDQLVGALILGHYKPEQYSPREIEMLLTFAYQIAIAIENAQLYLRVKQHSDELEAVFMVQQAITSRLDSEIVLQLIADAALRLTRSRVSIVYLVEGDHLRVVALSGKYDPDAIHTGYRIPISNSITGSAIQNGQPIHLCNIDRNSKIYPNTAERADTRCYLAVPLLSATGTIGAIAVGNKQVGKLGSERERVLSLLATGAVVALENAELYRDEQQRRRVAEGLRDMLAILNSNRSVDEILDCVVEQAGLLLHAKASAVFALQSDRTFAAQANRGLSKNYLSQTSALMSSPSIEQTLFKRQPVIFNNLTETSGQDLKLEAKIEPVLTNGFRSMLAVPLIVKNDIYGSLALYYGEPREFSADELDLAIMFCDQAALAIENARLQAQAEEAAAIAERNRLARDLHDAVSQTLFSASLIAGVLPQLLDKNESEAKNRANELRQLTRGALAEMRILLLELRPNALTDANLGELIRHLMEAAASRTGFKFDLDVSGKRKLPPDVQLNIYRIVQEALNNIVKHAGAKHVVIRLEFGPEQVKLCIEDDGCGFEPEKVSAEHLGLVIMRERAESIGADLCLHSQSGCGTHIDVVWPRP